MSWRDEYSKFLKDAESLSLEFHSNEIAGPASTDAVVRVETALSSRLPPVFREFLLSDCGGIDLMWYFADSALIKLDGQRESISAGGFEFSANGILRENPQLSPRFVPGEYDKVYRLENVFAFASTPNGDQYGVITKGETQDSIVYLSHDIENIHGYTVGVDVRTFLTNYARLGFVGPEFWIWEQFTNGRSGPIDSSSPAAKEFLEKVRTSRRSVKAEEESRRAGEIARLVRFRHIIEPEARELIERKSTGRFLALLEGYDDLLSGALKARYEYLKKIQKG